MLLHSQEYLCFHLLQDHSFGQPNHAQEIESQSAEALHSSLSEKVPPESEFSNSTSTSTTNSRPSILHALASPTQPPSERTFNRVNDEALGLFAAGGETTGQTLSVLTYHLLDNPKTFAQLRTEILHTFGPPPPCPALQDDKADSSLNGSELLDLNKLLPLPYLSACISEALRLASPVSGRLPRLSPSPSAAKQGGPTSLSYKNYNFPEGTAVSMHQRTIHYDPSIFPEPEVFRPERWLKKKEKKDSHRSSTNEQREHEVNDPSPRDKPTEPNKWEKDSTLEKYLVPFSKGPRACAGTNLAIAELWLVGGNLGWLFNASEPEEEAEKKERQKEREKGVEGEESQHDKDGSWGQLSLHDTRLEDIDFAHDYFAPFVKEGSRGLRVSVG